MLTEDIKNRKKKVKNENMKTPKKYADSWGARGRPRDVITTQIGELWAERVTKMAKTRPNLSN